MSSLAPFNKAHAIHSICESNYHKLLALVPELEKIADAAIAEVEDRPSLYLKILEKNPYTLTIELSHCFEEGAEDFFEPAVKIRIYQDARTVEVLEDSVRPQVREALSEKPYYQDVVNYKWSLNYFLEKWLSHCLNQGYSFSLDYCVADTTSS